MCGNKRKSPTSLLRHFHDKYPGGIAKVDIRQHSRIKCPVCKQRVPREELVPYLEREYIQDNNIPYLDSDCVQDDNILMSGALAPTTTSNSEPWIQYPPHDTRYQVVDKEDLGRLMPDRFLNDNIVNFMIRYTAKWYIRADPENRMSRIRAAHPEGRWYDLYILRSAEIDEKVRKTTLCKSHLSTDYFNSADYLTLAIADLSN